ncbi:hypothetical protein M8C21_018405, partial [Ambrosia artemisiifolia]
MRAVRTQHLLRGTRVPYTVALLIIGVAMGSLEYGTGHRLGKVGDGIRIWANIDPDLLLAVFLPALLFESSFTMDVHQIKKCMAQMVLLAGPGVLISTFFIGAALKLFFPYNWSWKTSLLLGGLLGATDPVAVVAFLKELGASKKLSTIIEGESVMNDGVSIVIYMFFFRMVTGSSFGWGTVLKFFAIASLGAVGMGMAFGLASYMWLGFMFDDIVVEITLTLAVSYLAYCMAQEGADVSGVLTVMTLGMFYALVARTAFRGERLQHLHHFCGVVIAEGGIVFLTLIINGSTTQFVLRMLKMDKLSIAKRRILHYTKCQMMTKAQEVFGDLGDDEELGSAADWPTIKKYFTCLNNTDEEHIHPHTASESVQTAYRGMLVDRRINQSAANILMQSVDGALDLVSLGPLSDWNGLKAKVQFPSYYKFLQTSWFPQKLVTYFTVERLKFACYISVAFLHAHRIARQQLHEFMGDSEIALAIITESEKEGEEAKKFLEDVRLTFPEVLHVVKTRQVGCSVLHHLFEYVQDLEKVGLLGQMELVHLHDAVQNDLEKLVRNLPLVKIPKVQDLISENPLLRAIPSAVLEQIVGNTKEAMKVHGVPLYKEGSNPNGIWLISKGVVKCDSKRKPSFNSTFAQGSTLGLYEVLIGKPYKCDIITDSVVLCFFIEAEKILSVLGTDHAVADLLWQESSIILSKLLIPQIFEKMSMQEARTFVAENSTMTTYIAGETIELADNVVGLLLDGVLKPLGSLEPVTAPAALLPSNGKWLSYAVETRARVMTHLAYELTLELTYEQHVAGKICLVDVELWKIL